MYVPACTDHLDGHFVTIQDGTMEWSEAAAVRREGSGSSEVTQEVGHTAEGGNKIKSHYQKLALIEDLTTDGYCTCVILE